VTGFQAGVPNAFLGDPTTVSGTPGFFSVGTPATANVGNYAIIVSQGTLSATNGYTFAFNSTGLLTVNPQALTITANDATQTYDNVAFSGGNGVTYSGFVNGQNASVLSGTITFGGNSQGAVNVGTYTIIPSGLSSSNYKINYVDGTLTINPAPINPAPINPAPINPAPINPAPIAVGNLDTLAIIANAAGTTSPSLVMNTTVLPTSPGNVMLFSGNTVLPYGDDAGPAGGSTNQQTSDVSVDLKRRRIIVRTR
jgi:MBG domain (YGX type)